MIIVTAPIKSQDIDYSFICYGVTFNYGFPVNHFQFNNHTVQKLSHQALKKEQLEIIRKFLNGRDVFGVLLTY